MNRTCSVAGNDLSHIQMYKKNIVGFKRKQHKEYRQKDSSTLAPAIEGGISLALTVVQKGTTSALGVTEQPGSNGAEESCDSNKKLKKDSTDASS